MAIVKQISQSPSLAVSGIVDLAWDQGLDELPADFDLAQLDNTLSEALFFPVPRAWVWKIFPLHCSCLNFPGLALTFIGLWQHHEVIIYLGFFFHSNFSPRMYREIMTTTGSHNFFGSCKMFALGILRACLNFKRLLGVNVQSTSLNKLLCHHSGILNT